MGSLFVQPVLVNKQFIIDVISYSIFKDCVTLDVCYKKVIKSKQFCIFLKNIVFWLKCSLKSKKHFS